MSETHYIVPFTHAVRGQYRAVCSEYVDMESFSPEPSCARCAAWIATNGGDRSDETAEDVFGPPNPYGSTVKREDFNPCAGYLPRMR